MNTNQLTENTLSDMNKNLKPKDDIGMRLNSGNISSDKEIPITDRNESELKKKLRIFTESNEDEDVIKSNLNQVRELFKPREKYPASLSLAWYIFNSIYNRLPNFKIRSVLVEKAEYALRIGVGIASYNTLPLSWINDGFWKAKSFLMKDRGHITTLICDMYDKAYSIKMWCAAITTLLKKYRAVPNWKEDERVSAGVNCLIEVESYLNNTHKILVEENGLQNQKKLVVSLKDIADNVDFFNQKLNYTPISIEVRKESVWCHAQEILAINNIINKWNMFQMAFLNWTSNVMKKDGSDDYFRTKLKIDELRTEIDNLHGFNIDDDNDLNNYPILSEGLKKYKKSISQYNEIIPFRYLSIKAQDKKLKDRKSRYYVRSAKAILEGLDAIFLTQLNYKKALADLKLADKIIKSPMWSDVITKQKELLKNLSGSVDKENLTKSSISCEDFGLACIDAVSELKKHMRGMTDRNPQDMVDSIVQVFANNLNHIIEKKVNDESIFGDDKSMTSRFQTIVYKAYEKSKEEIVSGEAHSKESLYDLEIGKIKPYLNGQTEFKILKPKDDYNVGDVKTIDFNKPREEAGIDLGKQDHSKGYDVDNVLAQVVWHNRQNNGDCPDTLTFWKDFSTNNLQEVEKFKQELVEQEEFDVISDAKKLNNIFNG
tara:strand:- start:1502 stop:3472 length:1971 start_codon:yes stop_codon:yes gene_type:complete